MGAAAPKLADVTVRLLTEGLVRAGSVSCKPTKRMIHGFPHDVITAHDPGIAPNDGLRRDARVKPGG